MSNDNEIKSLKYAYKVWQSLNIATEFGPLRGYYPDDHAIAEKIWRDLIDPAVGQISKTTEKTTDGVYLTRAASPWHAYFYLRAQQQYIYRAGRPLGVSSSKREMGEHLFFRGQRCASWDFCSSLHRKKEMTKVIEKRAVSALTEYFRSMFITNDDIAQNTAQCFAQHYGVATDLADVSCEPDIAIWFATHPFPSSCPKGEANASVRAVSWAGQRKRAETVCLLAPPFVRNVYTQRGLFIDTSDTDGLMTGKIILQVEFPRHTVGGEFRVRRQNEFINVWPVPNESEKKLVGWARQIALAAKDQESIPSEFTKARSSSSLPDFWLVNKLWDKDAQITDWFSILDWVLPATCVTALPVSGLKPMRYEIQGPKVKALVKANPTFFHALTNASNDADFRGFESLHEVLKIARDVLKTM